MSASSFNILVIGSPEEIEGPLLNAFVNKNDNPYEHIPAVFDPYPAKIQKKVYQCYFNLIGKDMDKLDNALGSKVDSIIFHFSISDRNSFNDVKNKYIPVVSKRTFSVIVLIGINDCSKERIEELKSIGDCPVTNDEAISFARENNLVYHEVQIENRIGIEEAFSSAMQIRHKEKKEKCTIA